MTATGRDPAQIEIVSVEPQLTAIVRNTVSFADLSSAQREARALLDAMLNDAGITNSGRTLTVWRPPQGGMIDYAPGVFVPDGFRVSGTVSLFTLPHGRAAHLRMRGSFMGLPDAWERVFSGIKAQEAVPAGLNWEIYATPDVPPDEAETDLYALLA
ncbi:AraC family transcriptional regulator [Methylobacterium sp. P1-11]|uniref:GyrI-like domain-containing protein n=1 Tax=Methylobacterium sp. P1-11 TaxID=2024616 RepID=UPI0011EBC077|nr:GyrI-like domain-containing protein [Methylobacterium sp. P1-11]KAA0121581.1 AraC family transcriptional regulator [Methylobacterium sp. P1-11]